MSTERKRLIWTLAGIILIILIACTAVTGLIRERQQEAWLDAEELHYDADGPFILIDRETAQMGYYAACTPVWHLHSARIRPEFMEGVYRAYRADNGLYFFYDSCGILAYKFVLTLTDAELDYFRDMPDGIPVLVR